MGKISTPKVLSIYALYLLCLAPMLSAFIDTEFESSLNRFSRKIFNELVKSNGSKNIIYSPFSIQSCLAMIRMGAEGLTAEELDRGLSFSHQNLETVLDNYRSMLAKYENSEILNIANKIYVMESRQLSDQYNVILSNNFHSIAENIDFSQPERAATTINSWAASQSNNMIGNLVSPDNLNANTRLLLLSAIHFDGKWATEFPVKYTKTDDFYIDDFTPVKVQMMKVKSTFLFGLQSGLKASAILLPYKNSDLSMLILLPYDTDGLKEMQEKLKNLDFPTFLKMNVTKSVQSEVHLPKFKADIKIELTDVLKKLGMEQMFSAGDFGKMLKSPEPLAVSEIIHQASIEVSEEGTVAAAATAADHYNRNAPHNPFYADHPFYYAIVNEDCIPLFEGTFVGV